MLINLYSIYCQEYPSDKKRETISSFVRRMEFLHRFCVEILLREIETGDNSYSTIEEIDNSSSSSSDYHLD